MVPCGHGVGYMYIMVPAGTVMTTYSVTGSGCHLAWQVCAPQWSSQGGRVTRKCVCGYLVGPPLGPWCDMELAESGEQVAWKSMSEHIVHKVLHKKCVGIPSN